MTTDHAEPAALAGQGVTHAHAPTGVTFELQGWRAGVVTRCAANAIDLVVMIAILAGLYFGIAGVVFLWAPRDFTFPAPSLALTVIVASGVAALYFAVAWMTTGRTYGSYVLGVRVVARDGRRLRPGIAIVRAAACVTVPIGLLWVGLSEQNRSWQDILLRTAVVYDWQDELPPSEPLHAPAGSSEVDDAAAATSHGPSSDGSRS